MSTRHAAFITGISGPELSADERAVHPRRTAVGLYPVQAERRYAGASRAAGSTNCAKPSGEPDAPVLIDQEGGRVQRLGPPHWPVYPPGAVFGALYDIDPALGLPAARLSARLIADDLSQLGITVDCLPLADVPVDGADAVIGNRAYGTEPGQGRRDRPRRHRGAGAGWYFTGSQAHSRAWTGHRGHPFQASEVDTSKTELERTDFAAFQPLADLPMAMTAHVVFSALDPAHPATTSATIIEQVIRGVIGFQGLLMSDDVSMNALAGSIAERTRAIFARRLRHGPALQRQARRNARGRRARRRNCRARRWSAPSRRWRRAKPPQPFDRQAARAELDALIDRAGMAGA